jgi:biopolymer transport protein ExbD
MKYILEVCLVALALTTSTKLLVVGQSGEQPLQKGISVQLPVTSNAVPVPDADRGDASIVSVTENGSVYFGTDLTTPAALTEKARNGMSNRTTKLYIKADARTPYANVAEVLDAVRTVGVESLELLTNQIDTSKQGTRVSPQGLEVSFGTRAGSSERILVQMLKSEQQQPALKINDEPASWATLQSALWQLSQSRNERVVLLNAEGSLPFADVVAVTDLCRSTGAKVILVTPGQ